jgi:RNA 3'-terminal phosphate cyclase (ATP)
MIQIDGSMHEGGGQIIRTALALSTLTGKPFTADNIRHGRREPGLKAQHLSCIHALKELSGAFAEKAEPGSEMLVFTPGKIVPKTLSVDIGTAGSITLLLQSILLPCCFADGKTRLKIRGGTDVKWSMPIDYFTNLVLPHYKGLAEIKVNEMKRGFYPKGSGFLDITIRPRERKDTARLELVKKQVISKISGVSSASSELRQADVSKRQASAAKKKLSSLDIPVKIVEEYTETESTGTVITLWAGDMGSSALGERRKRAEAVGAEAGAELLVLLCSDAVVDSHLADNLIPLMALHGGRIRTSEMTGHMLSNINVCEKFLDERFSVDEQRFLIETA